MGMRRFMYLGITGWLTIITNSAVGQNESIVNRDLVIRAASEERYKYQFPAPVLEAQIEIKHQPDLSFVITFSGAKQVVIPNSFLKCFPSLQFNNMNFRFIEPDVSDPNWAQNWWSTLSIQYSQSRYPYLQLQIKGFRLDSAILYRSAGETKSISSFDQCPDDTISWSLSKEGE